jgi:iron complex transport system substrate-binding protein
MKNNKTIQALAILAFILTFFFCGQDKINAPEYSTKATRIICASPSITEIVFALGLGEKVVGVSDFSVYPPEVRKKDKIGGLFNPNREKIITLQPDLLIAQGSHRPLAKLCHKYGIRFLSVKIDTLADIFKAISFIGQELQVEENADILVKDIQKELEKIREKTQKLPPRKVFLSLGHTPGDLTGLMTTSSGTFIHELVGIAGGENIFEDAAGLYPHISKEALLMRQPEIIIEVFPEGISAGNRDLLRNDWERLAILPAVKGGRIHFLTEDYLLIPGVRIVQIVKKFAEIIHPEINYKKNA